MQNWHAYINSHSRLHFYKHFKSLVTPEKYLNIDIKFHLRKSLARFRCSSHKFKIEIGRHQNISREARICSFCFKADKTRLVENEYHVFFIVRNIAIYVLSIFSPGTMVTPIQTHFIPFYRKQM